MRLLFSTTLFAQDFKRITLCNEWASSAMCIVLWAVTRVGHLSVNLCFFSGVFEGSAAMVRTL
jgi:hypothetical protein